MTSTEGPEEQDSSFGSPEPLSDDDTFAVVDDALTAVAVRRGSNLSNDLEMIELLASLSEQAERCLPEAVSNARAKGSTWDRIAGLLGTSPDEARPRFDPDSPIADGRWPYCF
ncbi:MULTISPECIES: hypothetical protein [Arthrobacter]|uniref:hypothetical protein n=1 Tax=Arthrobacter TaxID=1663 RepID=UPI001C0B49B5|nr:MULTISPECIES: hypothetical protein [Arthrobacter]MDQ0212985.1 hypothetical protein [Arthrobacter bambusae]MDQ0237291.1 hypothetical protein [Arthrobacter bambusae]